MKIYFAGSIRGGRDDVEIYQKIIEHLKKHGEVLSEHIGNKNIRVKGEERFKDSFLHNRDLKWLLESDVVVAEVTTPSLGIGYEIGRAAEQEKKILCLFRRKDEKKLSAMISGCPNAKIIEYEDIGDVREVIDDFFRTL